MFKVDVKKQINIELSKNNTLNELFFFLYKEGLYDDTTFNVLLSDESTAEKKMYAIIRLIDEGKIGSYKLKNGERKRTHPRGRRRVEALKGDPKELISLIGTPLEPNATDLIKIL